MVKMRDPQDHSELQPILGMLRELNASLRDLKKSKLNGNGLKKLEKPSKIYNQFSH